MKNASTHDRTASGLERLRKLSRTFFIINMVMTVVSLGVGYFVVETDAGRQWFGRTLAYAGSDGIPGSVTIGRVEKIGLMPLTAVVRDLRFLDPKGTTVLHARDASLVIDPLALITGGLHVERAQVTGGQILIAIQPDGRTSLEAALIPPGEKGGMEVRFDAIHVRDYVLELKLAKDDRIRVRVDEGKVAIKTPPVVVDLIDIRGRVEEPAIAGANVEIDNADGWVHGSVPHVLELTLQTKIGAGKLDAKLSYFNRDKTKVVARVHAHDGMQAEIAALMLFAKTWGEDAVKLSFDEKVTAQAKRD